MNRRRGIIAMVIGGAVIVSAFAVTSANASSIRDNPVWCGMRFAVGRSNNSETCKELPQANVKVTRNKKPTTKPTAPVRSASYVALGDSVAAGMGLPAGTYKTDADLRCGRSSYAYPQIVANQLGKTLVNKSCSGATAGDLITQQRVSGPNIPAQIPEAFAGGVPSLITITAGANDARWADFIKACYAYDCTEPRFARAASAYRGVLRVKLTTALTAISTKSSSQPPQTIVTGYYNPVSHRCTAQYPQITSAAITWIGQQTEALNQAIKSVTDRFNYVDFVPISFVGHDACASTPWVQGVNDSAPFHPTAYGQRVLASQVVHTVR